MKRKHISDLSIIIPVYNQIDYTINCIESIRKNTTGYKYEIIIVDNASTDNTYAYFKANREISNIVYLKNKRNLGFAKACNIGAKKAKYDNLVFLNNDTEVLPNWIDSSIKLLQNNNIGIVGIKLLYPDRSIQHAGINFLKRIDHKFTIWPEHVNRNLSEFDKRVTYNYEPHAVTGACLFIKKITFQNVGGFSTEYKMYFEDLDLCFKVRNANKKIIYNSVSSIIHHEGKSTKSQKKIDIKNLKSAKIFFSKWETEIKKLFPKRDIIWASPFFNPSGYASEAIAFALGIEKYANLKILHDNGHYSKDFVENMPERWRHHLFNLCNNDPQKKNINLTNDTILISHQPANSFLKNKAFKYHIGRTMFETNSIPFDWVKKCNGMDEIWVPSKFNKETFSQAGVENDKIYVVPEGIDTDVFNPENVSKLELKLTDSYKFLSIFEWTERKGAEILLKAYFEEFSSSDKVCLYLRTYILSNYDSDSGTMIANKIESLIDKYGYEREKLPAVEIISEQLPFDKMLSLYKSVDAFVLPSRGEGWGRPYMEAMAMELPVIGTNWSGNTEFMKPENSYLLEIEGLELIENMEIPFYKGQKWAKPSLTHLKSLLRYIVSHQEEAKNLGKAARKYICENYSISEVAKIVVSRINTIEKQLDTKEIEKKALVDKIKNSNKVQIIWEGDQFSNHSLAHVNRELTNQLILRGNNLSLKLNQVDEWIPNRDTPHYINLKHYDLFEKADITIRHKWPIDFSKPACGKWVMIQPWEYGSLPKKWVQEFSANVDEMWVPSNYVKKVYCESGIPKERVFVVPNGFNPDEFNRNHKPYKLKTKKKFKYLFVGGTIYRKGIDILIKAYVELFNRKDNVCLVIKDIGGSSFYAGQNIKEAINKIVNNNNAPEIEYIDSFLSTNEIAGLYNTCDVLVHPYRGEGFGMPILEAMACGLPAIVTNGGACLDFCNSANSFLVEAERVYYKSKQIGEDETVDYPWLFEASIDDLKEKMNLAFMSPELLKIKGDKAFCDVREKFTWNKISEIVEHRVSELSKKGKFRPKKTNFNKELQEFYGQIKQFYDANKYSVVISKVEEFLSTEIFEKSQLIFTKSELLLLVGFSYLQLNSLEMAHKNFEQALELIPNSSNACFGLGEVFYKAEMFEESKTMLEWSVINDPNNKNAQIRLEEVNGKLNLPKDHNSVLLETAEEKV